MRTIEPALALTSALLLAAPAALADDDVQETMKKLGVEETKFEVVDEDSKRKMKPPEVDDSISFDLTFETEHRDDGQHYQDPFLGREVFPELSAQLSTRFVTRRIANDGEPNGKDGRMTLTGRVDASLWFLDVRVPFDADRQVDDGPLQLVLKAPFSAGDHHRFAPMVIFHAPMKRGLDESVVEVAFGYHYARAGFGLKLELSAFNAQHDRVRGQRQAGMIAYDGVVSYLFGDVIGVVVEVDGTTAISERAGAVPPSVGDTILRLAPGLRFFPTSPGLSIGLAGLFTFVPDGYQGFERDQGLIFDVGYTFF